MLNLIIDWSLRNRFIVIVASLLFAGLGVMALKDLDIDAFPDTTPVQVQINTVAPSLGPEEVERQISFPVEQRSAASRTSRTCGVSRSSASRKSSSPSTTGCQFFWRGSWWPSG